MAAGHVRARAIAVFGTGSNVGKSIITAGLCRLLWRRGVNVAPFKSQNMSLNSFATVTGGEMGRAQALQAQACHLVPHVDMNPILLKPESDCRSQLIIQGRVRDTREAGRYWDETLRLFEFVKESYERLALSFEAIVVEGAGSAAEVNLRARDIANWRVAELADARVLLVADIDQGGVFAQAIGTLDLLTEAERRRIIGIVVNKFRGDARLFADGVEFLERRTGVPVLGVVPFLLGLTLDEEDRIPIERSRFVSFAPDRINIAVIVLPRMSNVTDFRTLEAEEDVRLRYATSPEEVRGADAVVLPGSKNTIADLEYLNRSGFPEVFRQHVEAHGELIGVCGGYQMLGKDISDPHGMESGGSARGLGYLAIRTELTAVKTTEQVEGVALHITDLSQPAVAGYYIHLGQTTESGDAPCFRILQHMDPQTEASRCAGEYVDEGACRSDGLVWGTYIHGVFDNAGFRRAWLNRFRRRKRLACRPESDSQAVNDRLAMELDRWANHLQRWLDLDPILSAVR